MQELSCSVGSVTRHPGLWPGASALERVLCADDDPDIRAVLAIALGDLGGLQVSLCNDGTEVMERALISQPDLLLLDTRMPGLDGADTLAGLRKNPATRHIPVAFITADQDTIKNWREQHSDIIGVLAKPFDPITLAEQVREMHVRALAS